MDDPVPVLIAFSCFVGLVVLALLGAALRKLYWSDWAQDLVLRWTGESRRVMTAWGPSITPRVHRTRGALSVSPDRLAVRASAPAGRDHKCAAGPTVRAAAMDH